MARGATAAGTGTATITTVDDSGGGYTSIAIGQDGFPVISYTAAGNLMVAKCGNAACTGASAVELGSPAAAAATVPRKHLVAK